MSCNSRAIQSAQTIHDTGKADIIVVAEAPCVDADEVQQLTSSPRIEGQNYFLFDSYTELQDLADTVATGLCNRHSTSSGKFSLTIKNEKKKKKLQI